MTNINEIETKRSPEIEAFFLSLPLIPGFVFKQIEPYPIGAWEAKYNPLPVILGSGELIVEGEWADSLSIGPCSLVLIKDREHSDIWAEHSITELGLSKASLRKIAGCFSSPAQVLVLGGSPREGMDIMEMRKKQQDKLRKQTEKLKIQPEVHCIWNPIRNSFLDALIYVSRKNFVEVHLGMRIWN